MTAIILYRKADTSEEEVDAINEFFPATFMRTAIPPRIGGEPEWLVIGRYSVLPYYQELERDLRIKEALLVNTYEQHQFVADLGQWVEALGELTPRTWHPGTFDTLPDDKAFILKGQTNSKKFLWSTHMFAENKSVVREVFSRLLDDTLIGTQKIYVREYVPLVSYGWDINGLPVTKEFRFFVFDGEVLCGGYYWANHIDCVKEVNNGELPSIEEVPKEFLSEVTKRLGNHIMFYVVDVAQSVMGDWLVIDVNDAQMSGLSDISPRALYLSLYNVLVKRSLM